MANGGRLGAPVGVAARRGARHIVSWTNIGAQQELALCTASTGPTARVAPGTVTVAETEIRYLVGRGCTASLPQQRDDGGAVDVDAIKQARGTIDGQDHPRLMLLLLHVSREELSPIPERVLRTSCMMNLPKWVLQHVSDSSGP